ncbi:MAG TPA: hypothetical protein DDW28_01860 [Prevotella sp.]|mgnify:FL=1|nr:porin family protein [uncultured Prevotella sp.]HBF04891.1 hypothetical protein [Candidatus Segatella violae]
MKKLMMAAGLLLLGFGTSFAQNAVGMVTLQPKVGVNVACLTDEDDSQARVGFTGGVELGYQVTNKFALTGALMYSQQGAKVDYDELTGTMKLDYINIPILANVYVAKGLAVKAGIQPAFNVNKKITVGGISMDIEDAYEQGTGQRVKVKSFDFSIPMGLSYEINGLVFDARYNLGLSKIVDGFKYEGVKVQPDDKNSVFQLTIGYKFAL